MIDDDKFFASIRTANAVSPMYVRPCLHSQCDLVPDFEVSEHFDFYVCEHFLLFQPDILYKNFSHLL